MDHDHDRIFDHEHPKVGTIVFTAQEGKREFFTSDMLTIVGVNYLTYQVRDCNGIIHEIDDSECFPVEWVKVKGEPDVELYGDRWEYLFNTWKRHHRYHHKNCDAPTTIDGRCIMCGRYAPGYQPQERKND